MAKGIRPFGAGFAEELDSGKVPPVRKWTWKPSNEARLSLVEASWPGRTCTSSCNDERDDEMSIIPK